MRFTKMQGIGNDYIYIDCFREKVEDPARLSREMSDRHFGVGADGIVLICPSEKADFRMRMFNADGSESEMCGNATRCIAKYVLERGLTRKHTVTLETGAGIKILEMRIEGGEVQSVRVDMGAPAFRPEEIPVLLQGDRIVDHAVSFAGLPLRMTCVSMGNPHAVFFVEDAEHFDVTGIGPKIEADPLFPRKTNAEFATVLDRGHIRMRVWERGSGETMACGTGACATLAAAVLCGLTDREAELRLNGGNLRIIWDEKTGHILQEGPAVFVFDGEWGA